MRTWLKFSRKNESPSAPEAAAVMLSDNLPSTPPGVDTVDASGGAVAHSHSHEVQPVELDSTNAQAPATASSEALPEVAFAPQGPQPESAESAKPAKRSWHIMGWLASRLKKTDAAPSDKPLASAAAPVADSHEDAGKDALTHEPTEPVLSPVEAPAVAVTSQTALDGELHGAAALPAQHDKAGEPPPVEPQKPAKRRFRFKLRERTKVRYAAAPIRVIIGYLPEVTERDAIEYATGVAEKHFDQLGLASYDAFEYAKGFAYEVHEGGSGRAYLPQIIEYFNSQGAFRVGENVSVVLQTATRKVEVQRTRDGLAAIVLPESSDARPTEWLEPTEPLTPALNKRTGLLVAGAAVFATGFLALVITALLARYQPYTDPPPAAVIEVKFQDLPTAQWPALTTIAEGTYVRALRYRNGKWEPPEVGSTSDPAATSGALSADTLINEGNAIANAWAAAGGASSGVTDIQALVSRGLLPVVPAWADPAAPLAPGHVVSNVPVDSTVCVEVETRAGRAPQIPTFESATLAPGPFGCATLGVSGSSDLRFYRKL